jgi:hypothetical protein
MDDSPGSPQTVALIGTGLTSGANATLLPTSLTFAPQLLNSTSGVQTVTLGNYGTTAINISSITASANFADTHTCPTSLAAGATCPINVTFLPTTAGNLTGTISVKDSAPGSPQSIPLNGIGAAETTATINPVDVALICVASLINSGCSPPVNVTLTNTGASPLYIQASRLAP